MCGRPSRCELACVDPSWEISSAMVEDRLRQLPCFASGELQFTRCHDTEWHQIFVVENESTKAVVSQPSWTGLDALRIVGRKLKA